MILGRPTLLLCFYVLVGLMYGCDKPKESVPSSANQTVESKLSADDIKKLLNEALSEIEKKNYGHATEITIKITKSDPNNTEAYYLSAEANSASGNIKEAIGALEQAIKNGFNNAERVLKDEHLATLRAAPEFPSVFIKIGPPQPAKVSDTEISAGSVNIKQGADGSQTIKAGGISIQVPKD